ncbi:MAG TPA: magnesium/cobalt transporter CorA [Myxococcota bacterium]|nr:magnesium/cobalt transporter CorA [Myxococcota bacterium]
MIRRAEGRVSGKSGERRHGGFKRRRPPVGAAPGALVFPPGSTRLNVIRYDKTQLVERKDVPLDELPGLIAPGQVTWLEVEGLGNEDALRRIAELVRIHPLALADIVNVGQRPKAEAYTEFELVVCRAPCPRSPLEFDLEQVSLVLASDVVVTFHEGERDVFEPVRERIRRGGVVRTLGTDYLLYALVDVLIDGYYPAIEALGDKLESLEERVSARPTRAILREIHHVRHELLNFVRVVHQQRDAVGAMMRADHPLVGPDVSLYLRDSLDHALQISDVLDSFHEISLGLMEVYHSSLSQRTNEIIKVLTILSSIFIPLTFIVGIYGMNFEYMPELHWKYGYLLAWGIMAAVAIGLLAYFRSAGWLGNGDRE